MTMSMHTLSGAFVVGALDDAERAAFEEHLPTCRDCQLEVMELREAAVLMADAVAVPPPAELRSQVLADIRTVRPLPPVTGAGTGEEPERDAVVTALPQRRFRLATMAAAAAILAVIGWGATTQPWRDNTPGVGQVTATDRVLLADDAQHVKVAFADGSTAKLTRSVSQAKAVLATTGMRKAPSGKVYELWLRHQDGRMVPAGLMTGGTQKVLLTGNAATANAAGITIEPEGGSKTPTTRPIAMFDFAQA